MVISSNRRPFVTPTPIITSGRLRTIGNEFSDGANELFLGFKPASVCKKAGFLRVTGSGIYYAPADHLQIMLHLQFSRPGGHIFIMQVLSYETPTGGEYLFNFRADIPVGTIGTPYTQKAIVTSTINGITSMYRPGALISADPDDVWTAETMYTLTCEEPPAAWGNIELTSIVSEYLEN